MIGFVFLLIAFGSILIIIYRLIFKALNWKFVSVIVICIALSGFLFHGFPLIINIIYFNFMISLFICSMQDIKSRYVTGWQVGFLIVSVILVRFMLDMSIWANLISVIFSFFLLFFPYLLSKRQGLGLGDVIVFPIIAIILTPPGVIIIFMVMSLSALIYGLIMTKRTGKKQKIPLIPFMQIGIWLYLPLKFTILKWMGLSELYHIIVNI